MSVGGALLAGTSKLFSGPLGVVRIGFKGYDLGKTTDDAVLTPDQDIKDILYQQDGTKAADHVRTGVDMILSVTLGEINTSLLALLMSGVESALISAATDHGTVNRSIYQSMRTNEAGALKVAAVDENGAAYATLINIMMFYEAIPIINGDLVNWGADSQRNLPVEFRIKWHEFSTGESTLKTGAFGYWGDPTSEDVPAVVWPDVAGPALLTADASAAVTMLVTFGENIAFQTAFVAGHYVAEVEGAYVLPTAGVIATDHITLTFPAATFAANDDIKLSISPLALEDTQTTPNAYGGVNNFVCTDSI